VNDLVWDSPQHPKTESETRIWLQAVSSGGDPRKDGERVGNVRSKDERKAVVMDILSRWMLCGVGQFLENHQTV
jgi:hypothetical protein